MFSLYKYRLECATCQAVVPLMGSHSRLDEISIIIAVLNDVWNLHGVEFNLSDRSKTLKKVQKRYDSEGMSFLTKTLPRLGKAFDKALTGTKLAATEHGFKTMPGSELPMLMGEFFSRVLAPDGTVLTNPCNKSVKVIRQFLYLFYKYKLPYTVEQELSVIQKFKETDAGLQAVNERAEALYRNTVDDQVMFTSDKNYWKVNGTLHRARILLARLFARFDPKNVCPRNGPGAVAGKQKPWEKFTFRNVSANITNTYPYDAYFCASLGHVCDTYKEFPSYTEADHPARVILVQKDSRGPRLISAEPVDYQWIQQGLSSAIVRHVETHPLTKWNVFYTDQTPNQRGALLGSLTGRYVTLDLNEASDRVSVGLARLLFPSNVFECLMACRSSATELPSGEVVRLHKYAPMGSSLCFPVMSLTIWAILTAAAPNADAQESILVYGDDVIVPTAQAADAIKQLESAGLKINRDKSCTSGFFRESCGTDAFQGVDVTPVRFRTVWSESRSPNVYESFIAYANELYRRQYFCTYDLIARALHRIYGAIPDTEQQLCCPSLAEVSEENRPTLRRTNRGLQKVEFYVWDTVAASVRKELPGWQGLLRYFSEKSPNRLRNDHSFGRSRSYERRPSSPFSDPRKVSEPSKLLADGVEHGEQTCDREFCYICCRVPRHLDQLGATSSVSTYTQRHMSKLVRRWR